MCRVIIFLGSVGCRASRGQYYGRAELHVGSYTSLFSFCSIFFFFFFIVSRTIVRCKEPSWAMGSAVCGEFFFFFFFYCKLVCGELFIWRVVNFSNNHIAQLHVRSSQFFKQYIYFKFLE
jgi:hypothetical protein